MVELHLHFPSVPAEACHGVIFLQFYIGCTRAHRALTLRYSRRIRFGRTWIITAIIIIYIQSVMGRKPCRLQEPCLPVVILLKDHTALLKNNLHRTTRHQGAK